MDFNKLQFAYPFFLWGLVLLPLVWLLYAFFYRKNRALNRLEQFVDPHLMKYLLVKSGSKVTSIWKALLGWSIVWAVLIVALAGPRWDYREIETYTADQNLIILLDLSQSMDSDDVRPTRLVRARQKIEDLLNQSKGVQIGLVAFAADPHMITPLTQDTKTIKHLLPSLDTNLVHVQGSRLAPALEMAETMFTSSPGENQAVLVVSDGGFEDSSAMKIAQAMSDKGIHIYTMGVGTTEGAPVRDRKGNFVKKRGKSVLSKLERDKLQQLSQVGNGRYLSSNLAGNDELVVLNDLSSRSKAMQELKKTTRIWNEEYYWFIIPALPFLLFWIRRGHIIPLLFFVMVPSFPLHAGSIDQYFMNSQQLGAQALEEQDYEAAHQHFEDPYRKGVAQYRAGNFSEAEKYFRTSDRPEVEMNAEYNTGNALAHQEKFEEAKKQFEKVLKKWPDHEKARHNLEIINKILEKEEQEQQDNQDSGDSDEQESDDQSDEGKQSDQSDDKEGSDQDQESEEQKDSGDQKDENEQQKDEEGPGQQDEKEGQEEPGEEKPDEESDQSGEEQEEEEQSGPGQDQEEQASPEQEQVEPSSEVEGQGDQEKSEEDYEADQWLNRMNQEPTEFLRNKFYIESVRKGTKEAVDPW